MELPIVNISEKWNQLSAKFDSLERQYTSLTSLVYRYQTETKGNIEVAVEIAKRQLTFLQEYIGCPVDKRKIDDQKRKISEWKAGYGKECVEAFRAAFSGRKGFSEGGEIKALTPEMLNRLCREFSSKVTEQIESDFKDFEIDEETDLLELQKKLEEKIKNRTEVLFEIFEQKVEVQEIKEDLIPLLTSLEEEKEKLSKSLTQAVGDIFSAAQVGEVNWLKNALSKLSSSKAAFVNQKKGDSKSRFTALHTAAYFDHADFLRLLLINRGSVNVQDQYRYTPLHFAAKRGAVGVTRILLDFGAKVNARGEYGRTPLIMAAFNGHPMVAQLLVSRGVDVNSQNEKKEGAGDGLTPLHQAVVNGRLEIVKVLVESPQLDVLKCDVKGFSPLYYAFQMGLSSILDLLLNHRNWADPKDPKNPNRLENLLKISSKERSGEVVKVVHQKQKEVFRHKMEEALRKEKLSELESELKKYHQERTRQLKSNGVPRSQCSTMVEHEIRQKREERLDQIEKEIQNALKEMIKKEEKRKVGTFEDVPLS